MNGFLFQIWNGIPALSVFQISVPAYSGNVWPHQEIHFDQTTYYIASRYLRNPRPGYSPAKLVQARLHFLLTPPVVDMQLATCSTVAILPSNDIITAAKGATQQKVLPPAGSALRLGPFAVLSFHERLDLPGNSEKSQVAILPAVSRRP